MLVHCAFASAHVRGVPVNNKKHEPPLCIAMSPPVHGRASGESIAASTGPLVSTEPSVAFESPLICTPQPASTRTKANRIA